MSTPPVARRSMFSRAPSTFSRSPLATVTEHDLAASQPVHELEEVVGKGLDVLVRALGPRAQLRLVVRDRLSGVESA